nr:FAD-binding protein [Marinicella sp. W31]MDC2877083.1 FAD-binding protein [Marinicella sp. W31]
MILTPDFDLTRENTLGLKSTARLVARIEDASVISALLDASERHGLPLRILGGGSNVVLRESVEAVVGLMRIAGRRLVEQTATHNIVEAGAGENWHDFVAWTLRSGFPGLENLAGIPGTVGAAPVQNIGAYGVQLSDYFLSLTAFDTRERKLCEFDRDSCGFGYRNSRFKSDPERYVILSVTLELPKCWKPDCGYAGLGRLGADTTADKVMAHVLALRGAKLPDWRRLGNAGSFFTTLWSALHMPIASKGRRAIRSPTAA